LLGEAVRETATEVLQMVMELDRTAFSQAHGGRRNGCESRGEALRALDEVKAAWGSRYRGGGGLLALLRAPQEAVAVLAEH